MATERRMTATTRLVGLILTILGIVTFYGTGQTSKTDRKSVV